MSYQYTNGLLSPTKLTLAISGLLLMTHGGFAQARLLDFDSASLSNNEGTALLDSKQETLGFTEQGFQFSNNMNIFHESALDDTFLGSNSVAFNDHWGNVEITQTGGGSFSFEGVSIKNWLDTSEGSFSVIAYNGTTELGRVSQTITADWMNFSNSFIGINMNRLVITATNSDSANFMIDNLNVSPVPEAESWAMMLLGLPLMSWVARRKI